MEKILKLKEILIENYRNSSVLYKIVKSIFVVAFSIMLLLDKKLNFSSNIYAKINEVYFNKFEPIDILFFLATIIITYIILTVIEIIYNKIVNKNIEKKLDRKANIKIYVIIFVLLIVSWSPYILSSFPGGIYGDTGVSINQATGLDELDNHHPLLYTLSIKLSIQIFHGDITKAMGLITIIQIIVMAAVFSYLVYWLYKRKAPLIIVVITTMFFMFFNLIPLYVMSNWKDSLFSTVLLAYIITIMDIIYQDGENLKKNTAIIKYVVAMFFVAFLRNNGIYIILATTIVLLIVYRKQIKTTLKKFTIISLVSILIFYFIQGPLYNKLKLNTESVESLGIPLQQICYVVATGGNITEEQEEFINQICNIEVIKEEFTPYIVDSIKWNSNFNEQFLSENKIEFIKIWFQIFLQNPKDYIVEYLLNTLGYWDINKVTSNSYIQYVNWKEEQPFAGVTQTNFIEKWTGKSLLPKLTDIKLISAALWVWILFLSCVLTIRNKKYKNLIILLPALLNWGTLMLATPIAFTLRYVYISILIVPLTIFVPIMKNKKKWKRHK